MANNGKYIKHIRHISRRIQLVRNDKECNLHNTVWCEGGLKLDDIGTNNVRGDQLNSILRHDMIRLDI